MQDTAIPDDRAITNRHLLIDLTVRSYEAVLADIHLRTDDRPRSHLTIPPNVDKGTHRGGRIHLRRGIHDGKLGDPRLRLGAVTYHAQQLRQAVIRVRDTYQCSSDLTCRSVVCLHQYGTALCGIEVMLVCRVCEEGESPLLSILYPSEVKELHIRISIHDTVEEVRHLLGCIFHTDLILK